MPSMPNFKLYEIQIQSQQEGQGPNKMHYGIHLVAAKAPKFQAAFTTFGSTT